MLIFMTTKTKRNSTLAKLGETTVVGTLRVNGDKLRLDRNTKTGELHGWNGSEGRTCTESELESLKLGLGVQ